MEEVVKAPLGFNRADIKVEPYEPFGFRNREDMSVGRFFFISRKEDRFTLNCNYREHGVNKNGKKFGRFKKLFSLTVTLRQPKTVGQMSMNVFYQGNIGGHKYKLLNITRNPSLVLGSFPSELNSYIVKEILHLVERQELYNTEEFKKLEEQTFEALNIRPYSSEVAIKLISRIAFPILENPLNHNDNLLHLSSLKIQNNNFETLVPPTFVMPLIRQNNIDSLVKMLKILPDNVDFFKKNIKQWNVDSLYYLNISRGLVNSETQKKLLTSFIEKENTHYRVTAHSWDEHLTGFYIPRIRQIIKTLNKESRNKILLDTQLVDYFSKIIHLWVGRSKFEKNVKINKNVDNVKDLYYELVEELAERKIEINTIKPGSINNLLEELVDGEIFKHDNSFDKAISGGFGVLSVWLPAHAQESGAYQSWFYYGEVDKNSPLWKPIFEDKHFISSPVEASGFTRRHSSQKGTEVPIVLSPKIYLKFLDNLKTLTLQELKKNNMEDTQANRSFTALIILAFNSYNVFKKYSPIPRKMFTLYKAGIHPIVIDYALRNKLSAKTIKEYSGLPLEWIEKLMGVKEGTFVKNSTAF